MLRKTHNFFLLEFKHIRGGGVKLPEPLGKRTLFFHQRKNGRKRFGGGILKLIS